MSIRKLTKKAKNASKMSKERLERMIAERDELKDRIGKLESFLGSDEVETLSEGNRILLEHQVGAMTAYYDILVARIELNSK